MRLVEIDGSNAEWQWNLSLSVDRIGDIELALGHTNAAASAYEESLALRRNLVEVDTVQLPMAGRSLIEPSENKRSQACRRGKGGEARRSEGTTRHRPSVV